MAAATAVISAGVALAGVGLSVNQAVQADKERKRAQQAATAAANRMKNIKEENAFKDIEMPTLGFELAQQSADRAMMSGVQSVQGAGAEAVIGALPGMMQVGSEQQLQLAAQANQAQTDIALQKAQAQQGVNFREAQAQRDFAETQLLGAQGAAAQAEMNKQQGIMGAVQGLGSAVDIAGKGVDAYKMQKASELPVSQAQMEWNKKMANSVFKAPQGPMTEQQAADYGMSLLSGVQYAPELTSEQMKYLSSFRF
jgi:hypothetical protein